MRKVFLCLALICGLQVSQSVQAAEVKLKIAILNKYQEYYKKLLETAFKESGYTLNLEVVTNVPQPRIAKMVEDGELSIFSALQTAERDAKYVGVKHKLTNGLIGQRVALVAKGNEDLFKDIKTLDDLKNLKVAGSPAVCGLGSGWFDVNVWKANGLTYLEKSGDWKALYPMLASKDRGVHYFPRGANEIMAEAKDHEELAVEKNIVMVYDRDMSFYLSKAYKGTDAKDAEAVREILEKSLEKISASGVKQKMIDEAFGEQLKGLNLDKRTKINLASPTDA